MTHESYKAWLDEMPIADVRRKIDRLEKKLWDLHVLERMYDERRGGEEEAAPPERGEGEGEGAGGSHAEGGSAENGEPSGEGHEHGEERGGG